MIDFIGDVINGLIKLSADAFYFVFTVACGTFIAVQILKLMGIDLEGIAQ